MLTPKKNLLLWLKQNLWVTIENIASRHCSNGPMSKLVAPMCSTDFKDPIHWQCVVICISKLKSREYTFLRYNNEKELMWQVLKIWLCSYMYMLVYVHMYNNS